MMLLPQLTVTKAKLSNPGKTYLGLGLGPITLQEVEEGGGYLNRFPVMSTPKGEEAGASLPSPEG